MSRTIQFVATGPEPEPDSEPGANYTPAYREFFGRLRRARIDKGLSLFEVAELVGLELPLAYEVENLIAPLPFEWLEVWCKVVGVPFDDYLAVYWASQLEWEAALDAKEAAQNAPCITKPGEVDASKTPELSRSPRGRGWLSILRAAVDRIATRFRSLFSTP